MGFAPGEMYIIRTVTHKLTCADKIPIVIYTPCVSKCLTQSGPYTQIEHITHTEDGKYSQNVCHKDLRIIQVYHIPFIIME